jgi:hypothetical protein
MIFKKTTNLAENNFITKQPPDIAKNDNKD